MRGVVFVLTVQSTALDPTYSVMLVLINMLSSPFFHLSFLWSTAVNVFLLLFYCVLTVGTDTFHDSSHLVETVLFQFSALVIFTYHSYTREVGRRFGFLKQRRLAQEEERAQRVLAKMLPLPVIEKLRLGAQFVFEYHGEITVLFSHLHDFDSHTAHLRPHDLIALLNHVFSRFDAITDQFGVYKVETIGDVYLISAGAPEPIHQHAAVCTRVALTMRQGMDEIRKAVTGTVIGQENIELQVGLHSGSVIAGVVGLKYPRYRLMGDTVNTASRMSTTCPPSHIQLSMATYQRLPASFTCQCRGGDTSQGGKET